MGKVFFSPEGSTGLTWLPSQSWQDFKDSKVCMERQRKWDYSMALRMKTKAGGITAQDPQTCRVVSLGESVWFCGGGPINLGADQSPTLGPTRCGDSWTL